MTKPGYYLDFLNRDRNLHYQTTTQPCCPGPELQLIIQLPGWYLDCIKKKLKQTFTSLTKGLLKAFTATTLPLASLQYFCMLGFG